MLTSWSQQDTFHHIFVPQTQWIDFIKFNFMTHQIDNNVLVHLDQVPGEASGAGTNP